MEILNWQPLNSILDLFYSFDVYVLKIINSVARQSNTFDTSIKGLSKLTLMKGAVLVSVLWWIWFRKSSELTSNRIILIRSMFGLAIAIIVGRFLQLALPYRARPLYAIDLHFIAPYGVKTSGGLESWSSFPSDHAVLFFALSTAVWFTSRTLGVAAYVWTLVVICIPRIYLGFHFPTDILFGAIIGIGLMYFFIRTRLLTSVSETILEWEQEHKIAFYVVAILITFQIATLFDFLRKIASDSVQILKHIIAVG